MNFNFRKLTSKTQSIISILKLLHKEKRILINKDQDSVTDYLEIVKQKIKVQGLLSILKFFNKQDLDAKQFNLQWWLFYNFKKELQGQKKKSYIPEYNLQKVENLLKQSQFLNGEKLGELDIIAYVRIARFQNDLPQSLKKYEKLQQWFAILDKQISPLIQPAVIEKEIEEQRQLAQKQQEAKDKKDKKKQVQKKPVPAKQEAPAKKAPKKEKEVIDPEYLKKFNSQKINRLEKTPNISTKPEQVNKLITSALPYCNNAPHLGTLIGCVLSADVYARYCRLRGYNTIYVCGTDEYGTATEMRARQEGITPEEICAKYWQVHDSVYRFFDIDFDIFGRTSTPKHTKIAQDIFLDLKKNDMITQNSIEQYFCEGAKCQTFLADRFVKGVCPHCKSDEAKGDQCDACGKLVEKLDDPKCVNCNSTPILKSTDHFYINLPKIQPQLEQWIEKQSVDGYWSNNSISISKTWCKNGLQERCITRDLRWGTPVPVEGWEKKVFYVWFDAPIGYISITANLTDNWEKWWKNPEHQVENVQFMAKDNIPFHCVIFPCTLIGQSDNWTKLHHISSCEYLNYEGTKFSKSKGIGVFGDDAQSTGIPPEVWRYYLLINRPEKQDTNFTWREFGDRNNNELLANPGNFANRGLKFCYKVYDKKTPQFNKDTLTQDDKQFLNNVWQVFQEYLELLDKVEIKKGLQKVMEVSSLGNQYLQENQPWVKENQESKRSDTIIFIYCNILRFLSLMFEPYLPSLSAKINFMLGQENRSPRDEVLLQELSNQQDAVSAILSLVKPGQPINQPVTLFTEYSEEQINEWHAKFGGKQN